MKKAIWGGIIAALMMMLGVYAVGKLTSYEALDLLKAMLPSTRFLCSAVLTATSTILALILTLISFTSRSEQNLKSDHYERISKIALLACIAFIAAVTLLMFINLPLEKAPENMKTWFEVIYYGLLVYTAVLGGLLITIVLMLYQAAHSIILIVHPDRDASFLIASEEEEVKEEEKSNN